MTWTLAIDVGKKNMGYALYDRNIIKYDLFNIELEIKLQKIKGDMPSKRIKVINNWLKGLMNKYPISMMIVEKQVKKNGVAMMIENSLLTLSCVYNIPFKIYDPKNKFTYIPIEYNSKRKEHKQISIHYAWNILYNFGLNMNHFLEFKKKDDISDAICMAFMSIENENTIKYFITDHTNNPLLSDLTRSIKFKHMMN
jgi:hypothetical protein